MPSPLQRTTGGRSEATYLSGFTAAFDRAASHPSRSRISRFHFRTFSLRVAPSSRTRQAEHFRHFLTQTGGRLRAARCL
eukprot:9625385-Alexandrium_andersonii.AAC.1